MSEWSLGAALGQGSYAHRGAADQMQPAPWLCLFGEFPATKPLHCTSSCSAYLFWAACKTFFELRKHNPGVGCFQLSWRPEAKPPKRLLAQPQRREVQLGDAERSGIAAAERGSSFLLPPCGVRQTIQAAARVGSQPVERDFPC